MPTCWSWRAGWACACRCGATACRSPGLPPRSSAPGPSRMGENLDVHDVERMISDEAHGELGRQGAVPDPVKIILPGLRRVIQPKTAGQREYLRSIAEHDIVIGIGPAGTGKTYLAVAAAAESLARKRDRP